MTENEKTILELEIRREDSLSSELASRSSFIGTVATLAAFLIIQGHLSGTHPRTYCVLLATVGLSFVLLLIASHGQTYWYNAAPVKWFQWRSERMAALKAVGRGELYAAETSDIDLMTSYWENAVNTAQANRSANRTKSRILSASGTLAVGSVLAIVVLELMINRGLF